MANINGGIIPFIKVSEGLLYADPAVTTGNVPDGSGNNTNKGVTWAVFAAKFGNDSSVIARFYAMSDDDWGAIFSDNYWTPCKCPFINSDKVAYALVDWAYNAGDSRAEWEIQKTLNAVCGDHLTVDGNLGNLSEAAINAADENTLFDALNNDRIAFYTSLANTYPSKYAGDLQGWINRVNRLKNTFGNLA